MRHTNSSDEPRVTARRAIPIVLAAAGAAALAAWLALPEPAPAPDDPGPRPPAGLDDLDRFTVATAVVHGDTAWLLLAEQRIFLEKYRETPDHARGYARWFHIGAVREGRLTAVPIDCVSCSGAEEDFPSTSAAIDADDRRVRAFLVYRGHEMQWGADGAIYTLDPRTLEVRSKEPVFVNKNWGWTPFFDGEAVAHFSHANKNEYRGARRVGPSDNDAFRRRQLAIMRERSRGLVPGPRKEIIAKLKKPLPEPPGERRPEVPGP